MTPREFRQCVLIDCDGTSRLLSEVIEPWQEVDFAALDGGWSRLAGLEIGVPIYNRAWLERPRGHSKTSDIAVMCSWALMFSGRPLKGIAAAADADQAKLLRDAVDLLVRLNGWQNFIDVQNKLIINRQTGAKLEFITSDAMSSYGYTPDFVICDELTHWTKPDLWYSLLSASAKRQHCMLAAIMNAGFQDNWQHETREAVRIDPHWHFSSLDGPQASWITADRLDEQRRLLPGIAFDRLWLNRWSSGSGDALRPETIDAAVNPDHSPMTGQEPGFIFSAGLDLGIRRDKSALCVVGKDEAGKTHLAFTRSWAPPAGGAVDLTAVETAVAAVAQRFKCCINFDGWQAQQMRQQLRGRAAMREITFSGKSLQEMATSVLEAFNSGTICLYPDEELLRDLRKLRVVEKSYGFRLESPRDGTGHGDLGTAFQLALLGAKQLRVEKQSGGYPQGRQPNFHSLEDLITKRLGMGRKRIF